MAEKPKTPKPPVKVQAPKSRPGGGPVGGGGGGRTKLFLGVGGGLIVIVVIVVVLVLASSSSGGSPVKKITAAMDKVGCTVTTVPATKSALHVQSLDAKITYNSFPPTSGYHYQSPALWGNYSDVVNPRQAVHNEEHGGMIIWYEDIPASERAEITAFYDESPNGVLVTPIVDSTAGLTYPKHASLKGKVATTAWDSDIGKGVVATCPKFDKTAFEAFRKTFRGHGPERFPISSMLPGQ